MKGQDVVDSIGKVETGPRDRPVKDVVMNEVNIIRKGSAAKNFDAPKVFESELKKIEAEKEEELRKCRKGTKKASEFEALKPKADSLESGLKIYFENKGEGEKPRMARK